eukprot:gene323-429_t
MSRIETDSLGEVQVPDDAYWGAQTQRSLVNFAIGEQRMPLAVLHALVLIKKAAARVNDRNGDLPADIARLIEQAADEVLDGQHDDQFPLVVWQTGSGTQSNMNANEVLAGRANELSGGPRGGKSPVHPNDHVNRSQSSNDCFPTAMSIATVQAVHEQLLPALRELSGGLAELSARHMKLVKTGRTHMMDATPITFGQEVSAFIAQLDYAERAIRSALPENEFSGAVSAEAGSFDRYKLSGHVNIPLGENVSARVAAMGQWYDGPWKNRYDGRTYGGSDDVTVRGTVKAEFGKLVTTL